MPERELTRGWLKASNRALDAKRSKPWKPWHKLTREARQKVTPGKIEEYAIEIFAMANLFRKGHRICVEITSLDLSTGVLGATNVEYIPYHVCSQPHGGAQHLSRRGASFASLAAGHSDGRLKGQGDRMDLNLTGKSVLITGGSKGLGLAMARRFAAEGCDLHLAARSQALLEAAADAIRRQHAVKVNTLAIDLAQPGSAGRVVKACGDIDILVNNAGDVPSGSLETVDEARWRAGWDSKVFNYINLSREYFGRMKARGAGVIVNVTGIAGDLLDASYIAGSVGNAAMAAFTKALGSTSHKFGVRVVGINPGPCDTERYERLGPRQGAGAVRRSRALARSVEHAAVRPRRIAR